MSEARAPGPARPAGWSAFGPPRSLRTERLELVPASAECLCAELEGRDALRLALSAQIPASWPPGLYDRVAVHFYLAQLNAGGGSAHWGAYYLVGRPPGGGGRVAIGVGGFKGNPDAEGTVEIGYSVLPDFQHRGFAGEAVQGWLDFAFHQPAVVRVIAHTLAHLEPSVRVLERAGFSFAGQAEDATAPTDVIVLRYERYRTDQVPFGRRGQRSD